MQLPPLHRAVLLRRYKRFLADVRFEDGREETVHVPNPGAMLGLADPGLSVWTSLGTSKTRKLPHTLELVQADGGLVGVNTLTPNRLAAEALAEGLIPELTGYASVRREVKYGEASRVDFLLQDDARPPCWLEIKNCQGLCDRLWLEVKGVTLCRIPGLAEWPDCVSARATRHLGELVTKVRQGDRAAVLFVIQRGDCQHFAVAADLDPEFAAAFRDAREAGVQVLAYGCAMSLTEIRVDAQLQLPA